MSLKWYLILGEETLKKQYNDGILQLGFLKNFLYFFTFFLRVSFVHLKVKWKKKPFKFIRQHNFVIDIKSFCVFNLLILYHIYSLLCHANAFISCPASSTLTAMIRNIFITSLKGKGLSDFILMEWQDESDRVLKDRVLKSINLHYLVGRDINGLWTLR